MKSLILAAGYATRLYPLTKKIPKPLLQIGGVSILDRLIRTIDKIDSISQHIVITNANFYDQFEVWRQQSDYQKEIVIVNDGTTDNDNRLGAVRDILFAITQLEIQEDILVLAGDNVVTFSFADFINYAQKKGTSCISCHEEAEIEALQKTGVLETNDSFKVLAMHEKPVVPPSHWAVPPFYFYKQKDIPLIKKALDEGCGYDAPGNLIAWLCQQTEIYAWPIDGYRYDIGDLTSYERINIMFTENGE